MRIKLLSLLTSLFYFLGVFFSNNLGVVKEKLDTTKSVIIEKSKEEISEKVKDVKKDISFNKASVESEAKKENGKKK